MEILSVNIGGQRTQPKGPELEITGIYKRPISGPAVVTNLGLVGDFIGDSRHHGGPDQAIYVYCSPDYEWWANELGRATEPGTFGDNLTIGNMESAKFRIGDRLRIGELTLEVSAARIPCSTLSRRMGDFKFAAAFRDAERPGMYCRVIVPGTVRAGDEIHLAPREGETVTILEMFRDHYRRDKDEASLRRLLGAPVSFRARHKLQIELDRLLSTSGV